MKNRMIYQVDKTRTTIVSAAESLFRERGFFETQIKDIAGLAEVSRNTVYRYFHDKSDLAMAVIEKILFSNQSVYLEALNKIKGQKELTGLEKISQWLKMIGINNSDIGDSKLIAEFDAYYSGNRISLQMKERFVKLEVKNYIDLIISFIEEGINDESIRSDIDPHLTLVTILNAIRSLQQRIILRGEVLVETTAGETETMLPHLMELILIGLENRRKV